MTMLKGVYIATHIIFKLFKHWLILKHTNQYKFDIHYIQITSNAIHQHHKKICLTNHEGTMK